MPQQKSERTIQMMKHFMSLKREGYSNKEIAEIFGISIRTLNSYLDEIARDNNVSPDSLRDRPHKKHVSNPYRRPKTIQSKELRNLLDSCLQDSTTILEDIYRAINKHIKE